MVCVRNVIGFGETIEQALLYVRINQTCIDCGVRDDTISKKTAVVQIPSNIKELDNNADKIVMALHFASRYYIYQENILNGIDGEFTESEYKYFSIMIKAIGRKLFRNIMEVYFNKLGNNWCLGIHKYDNLFVFLY